MISKPRVLQKQRSTKALKICQWPTAFKPSAKRLAPCIPTLSEDRQKPFLIADDSCPPFNIDHALCSYDGNTLKNATISCRRTSDNAWYVSKVNCILQDCESNLKILIFHGS